jgi:hypothetical protein
MIGGGAAAACGTLQICVACCTALGVAYVLHNILCMVGEVTLQPAANQAYLAGACCTAFETAQ